MTYREFTDGFAVDLLGFWKRTKQIGMHQAIEASDHLFERWNGLVLRRTLCIVVVSGWLCFSLFGEPDRSLLLLLLVG
jgi:hypothetical protein